MDRIIECVPNFSEGRNPVVIKEIADVLEGVSGIRILNISSGRAANRTVITFAGDPDAVVEAAFRAIAKAGQLIDMSKHTGVHPRFGATDVCPLIPVSNITMEETVQYARKLAKRVGNELSIPVYCYEHAAYTDERRSLANCRQGGYEGLKQRMITDRWKPDFCSNLWAETIEKTGAVAIGARNFLAAYNINLNTTSTRIANDIALDVRESGRIKRHKETGEVEKDSNGAPLRVPGSLKKVRALGWFIEEFGIAQVSMNLTDLGVTSLHEAFEEVTLKAAERGVRVTGSELIGLIPLQALLDAGKYFLHKQKRSAGIADDEILKIAVKSLGLDDLQPFDVKKRVIEYLLNEQAEERFCDKSLSQFVAGTASESLGPGGGSVAAAVGALGAALAGMVANLSAQKRGWEDRWEEFSAAAEKAKFYQQTLLALVDEDARSFEHLNNVLKLPESGENKNVNRSEAVLEASRHAIDIPLRIMKLACESMHVMHELALTGNPNTISETGVGVYCAMAAVESALLNVTINAKQCADKDFVEEALCKADQIAGEAKDRRDGILQIVTETLRTLK